MNMFMLRINVINSEWFPPNTFQHKALILTVVHQFHVNDKRVEEGMSERVSQTPDKVIQFPKNTKLTVIL